MTPVPVLDFAFLAFESKDNPKHVAGLQVFELPTDAPDSFVADLADSIKRVPPQPPFNQRLNTSYTRMPQWELDKDLDLDDHVFVESVTSPGNMPALLERVAQVHAELLDRSGPLWELYFFEHLRSRRFAMYFKVHHAYMDGISISKRAIEALSDSPDVGIAEAFWGGEPKAHHDKRASIVGMLFDGAAKMGKAALIGPALAKLGLKHGLRMLKLSGRELPVPFTAPRTLFNTAPGSERSVAVCDISLARVQSVAQHAGVTVNDVLLELCDSAMMRYLREHGQLPERPLVAQMPISLRKSGTGQGNQIAIALLELGSEETNAVKRLQRIHTHARHAKHEYVHISEEAAEIYTLLMQSLAQLGESTGLGGLLPPLGNVVISNVIGPAKQLYLAGAPMLAVYPISTLPPGLSINITIYSYHNKLHVGMVATKKALPNLKPIADYLKIALTDLEQTMGLKTARTVTRAAAGAKKKRRRKPADKTRRKPRPKPGASK